MTLVIKTHDILSIQHNYAVVMLSVIMLNVVRHLNIVRFASHRHLDVNSIAIHRHLNIIRFNDRLLPTDIKTAIDYSIHRHLNISCFAFHILSRSNVAIQRYLNISSFANHRYLIINKIPAN
jgi:hypothetical protein